MTSPQLTLRDGRGATIDSWVEVSETLAWPNPVAKWMWQRPLTKAATTLQAQLVLVMHSQHRGIMFNRVGNGVLARGSFM